MTSVAKSVDVCVIGGGVGGCALGLFLKRWNRELFLRQCDDKQSASAPISFVVIEKDGSFAERQQGYGLTMQQGSTALRKLGLEEKIKELDTPNDAHLVFLKDGTLVSAFGRAVNHAVGNASGETVSCPNSAGVSSKKQNNSAKSSKSHNCHLPRQKLRELLLDDLLECCDDEEKLGAQDDGPLMWGWNFRHYRQDQRFAPSPSSSGVVNSIGTTQNTCTEEMHKHTEESCDNPFPIVAEFDRTASKTHVVADELHDPDTGQMRPQTLTVRCKVLVGADGIFSRVRQQMFSDFQRNEHADALKVDDMAMVPQQASESRVVAGNDDVTYLGMLVVLGWTKNGEHYLYDRLTWQSIDEASRVRMFAMPFTQNEVFWQLSFPCERATAEYWAERGEGRKVELLQYLTTEVCSGWHEPVLGMLRGSEWENISATPVYDRGAESWPFSSCSSADMGGKSEADANVWRSTFWSDYWKERELGISRF